MNTVRVTAYSAAWPVRFEAERVRLIEAIECSRSAVEHIGSTSVPGLSARPMIDIMVGLERWPDRATSYRISERGYRDRGKAGVDGRRFYLGPNSEYHLHVTLFGSTYWDDRLAFRDALRADSSLSAEYSALKAHLALQYPESRADYVSGKTEFITAVLSHRRRRPRRVAADDQITNAPK